MDIVMSVHFLLPTFYSLRICQTRVGLFPVTRKWQGRSVCSGSHITLFSVVPPDILAGENPSVSPPDDCSYCGARYERTISVIVIQRHSSSLGAEAGGKVLFCLLGVKREATGTAHQSVLPLRGAGGTRLLRLCHLTV